MLRENIGNSSFKPARGFTCFSCTEKGVELEMYCHQEKSYGSMSCVVNAGVPDTSKSAKRVHRAREQGRKPFVHWVHSLFRT